MQLDGATATDTRFARVPRWAAWLALAAAIAVVLIASIQPPSPQTAAARSRAENFSDIRLYQTIVRQVQGGADYYATAAAQQRAHHYPTWPPQVIREPTEAWLLARLGADGVRWAALIALAALTLEVLRRALAHTDLSPRTRLWALVLGATGLASACTPSAAYMHEVWAGILILLSLALRRADRWVLSIGAGVLACFFREIALPYLCVMAACALWERRYAETAGWSAAIALFGAVFALHLGLAGAQHRPGDLSSPGWLSLGGLSFLIATARNNALFVLAPTWVVAAGLAGSALGYVGCHDRWVGRCGLTLLAYMALFAVVGRPDNDYWGLLYAPLPALGLALAPAALRDLLARAMGTPAGANASWQALTSRGS